MTVPDTRNQLGAADHAGSTEEVNQILRLLKRHVHSLTQTTNCANRLRRASCCRLRVRDQRCVTPTMEHRLVHAFLPASRARAAPGAAPSSKNWQGPLHWVSEFSLTQDSRQPLCLRDVGFLVMASKLHRYRQQAVMETWARDVDPRALIFANTSGPDTFHAAQSRQFARMKSSSQLDAKKWVVLCDDDTLINVRHLVAWLSRFRSDDPLVLGHVLPSYNCFWGGAGMVLSGPAYRRMASSLRSGVMPLPSPAARSLKRRHGRTRTPNAHAHAQTRVGCRRHPPPRLSSRQTRRFASATTCT